MDEGPGIKDVPCAYCDVSVLGTCFVVCSACDVPLHRDCWEASRNCPAFGCGSTTVDDPAMRLFRDPGRKVSSIELPVPSSAGVAYPPVPATREEIVRAEVQLGAISRRSMRDLLLLMGSFVVLAGGGASGFPWLAVIGSFLAMGVFLQVISRGRRDAETTRRLRRRLDQLRDRLPLNELLSEGDEHG